MKYSLLLTVVLLLAWQPMSSGDTYACSTPVFRYALERWPADIYEVVIYHRGSLKPREQSAIELLQETAQAGSSGTNLRIHTVDLTASEDNWQPQITHESAWMLVRYPDSVGRSEPFWEGLLDEDVVRALVDSPARMEIARRILSGESVVWVLVESGDSKKDKAAAMLLQTELDRLNKKFTLVLSELGQPNATKTGYSGTNVQTDLWLKQLKKLGVSSSVLSISRSDRAERMFVQMLMGCGEGLEAVAEPVAFPVFGRGRMIYALIGQGINKENIEETCEFIVGWCSCQVKEQSQGIDLLMSVDWEASLKNRLVKDVEIAPLTSLSAIIVQPVETGVPRELPAKPLSGTETSNVLPRNILLAMGFIILVTVILVFAIGRRKRHLRGPA